MKIGYVEDFPTELQAVALHRHFPALAQGHVQTGVTIASNDIARTTSTRKRMDEVILECVRRVSENADRAIGLLEMSGTGLGHHLRNPLLVPICGPEVAVIYGEGKSAGPAGQSGELPATDESIEHTAGIAGKAPTPAKGQFSDPVGINLVRGVEVRYSAPSIRIKSVDQAGPGRAYVHARAEPQSRRRRSDVDRLGIGVVEIELHAAAELLSYRSLQCVVTGVADGAPGVLRCELVIQ